MACETAKSKKLQYDLPCVLSLIFLEAERLLVGLSKVETGCKQLLHLMPFGPFLYCSFGGFRSSRVLKRTFLRGTESTTTPPGKQARGSYPRQNKDSGQCQVFILGLICHLPRMTTKIFIR